MKHVIPYIFAILLLFDTSAVAQTPRAQETPQLVVRTANDAYISGIVFSQDSRFVLTSDLEGTVVLWTVGGDQLKRFHNDDRLQSVAMSADNRTIAFLLTERDVTGKKNKSALILKDIDSVRPDRRASIPGYYFGTVAVSPTSRFVLLGGGRTDVSLDLSPPPPTAKPAQKRASGICMLWDSLSRSVVRRIDDCMAAAFSPDEKDFATLSYIDPDSHKATVQRASVRYWHIKGGNALWESRKLESSSGEHLSFSIDGQRILQVNQRTGTYWTLNAQTGTPLSDVERHPADVAPPILYSNNYAVSPDEKYLAWDGEDACNQCFFNNTVELYDYSSGETISRLGRALGIAQIVRTTNADANKLVVVNRIGDAYIWNLTEGTETHRLAEPTPTPEVGETTDDPQERAVNDGEDDTGHTALPAAAISLGGRYVFTAPHGPFSLEAPLTLWDGENGRLLNNVGAGSDAPPAPQSIDILEKEKRVLIQECGALKLIDPFTTEVIWKVSTTYSCGAMSDLRTERDMTRVSADGSVALLGLFGDPNTLQETSSSAALIEMSTGKVRHIYPNFFGLPVAITPSGRTAAIARYFRDETGVKRNYTLLFDTATSRVIRKIPFAASAMSFSPDGRHLLLLSARDLVMVETVNGFEKARIPITDAVLNDVVFSPDGKYAIVAASDGSARFYLAAPRTRLHEVCRVYSLRDGNWVVVSPDGRFDTNNIEAIRGLVWIVPGEPLKPLPLEIFSRQYFEPGLLARQLKCNQDNTCEREFKPLPPIAAINRVQPPLGRPSVDAKEK